MAKGKNISSVDMENEEAPKEVNEIIEDKSVPEFSKAQLMKSNWYSHRRDILAALLEDGKMYSHADVDQLIENFLKREVK